LECGSAAPAFFVSYTVNRYAKEISNPLALIADSPTAAPCIALLLESAWKCTAAPTKLSTEIWTRVFQEAAAAGVLQADFPGGEPLARPDIVELVRAARSAGLYVQSDHLRPASG